jgi:hypothetical protein
MSKWLSSISTLVASAGILVILAIAAQFLPYSPFQSFISGSYWNALVPYLNAINYFVPISEMIVILEAWTVCIAEYWLWELIYSVTKSVSGSGTSVIPYS